MVFGFRKVSGRACLLPCTLEIDQYIDITKHIFGLRVRASGSEAHVLKG